MANRKPKNEFTNIGRPIHPEPTEKQLEVYYLIVKHVQEHGFQPSQMELAEMLGITRQPLEKRMVGLERKGFIERTKGKSDRAVRLKRVRFKAVFVPEE